MAIFKITEQQIRKIIREAIEKEGLKYGYDPETHHINYVKYIPNNNKNLDTSMFKQGTKDFAVKEKILPKTGVKSLNLYSFGNNVDISKIWKKGENRFGEKVQQDENSMKLLDEKNIMYMVALIRKYMPDVDYLISPSSSSDLNKRLITAISQHLYNKNTIPIKDFKENIFIKNVNNIKIDYEWLNKASNTIDALSPEELDNLKNRIYKWIHIDEPIRDLRTQIKQLEADIQALKDAKIEKRGRPSKEEMLKKDQINAYKNNIYNLRHLCLSRGIDSTVDKNGNVKSWQIKSLEDKVRKAIKGFMVFNPKLINLVNKFKDKKIVLIDDNISSGATVDDCCLAFREVGEDDDNLRL